MLIFRGKVSLAFSVKCLGIIIALTGQKVFVDFCQEFVNVCLMKVDVGEVSDVLLLEIRDGCSIEL